MKRCGECNKLIWPWQARHRDYRTRELFHFMCFKVPAPYYKPRSTLDHIIHDDTWYKPRNKRTK